MRAGRDASGRARRRTPPRSVPAPGAPRTGGWVCWRMGVLAEGRAVGWACCRMGVRPDERGAPADGAAAYCRVMETLPPTGPQHELVAGAHRAVITTVGATLREYSVEGRPIVEGFAPDMHSTFGRGQVLAPWPNRLRA